jgi:hypothetical protein
MDNATAYVASVVSCVHKILMKLTKGVNVIKHFFVTDGEAI